MHRGGGNSLKPSHNQGFSLIEAFNNLAPWGEKKFVSELKRTYKFQRGVNNILDCHANQTRILSKEYSFVAGDYVRSTARNDVKRHAEENSPKYRMVGKIYQCLTNVDKRLRNKCAMTCVEENILSLGGESGCLNEVNYNHERGLKHELINNEPSPEFLSDKFFSRFTSHFLPKRIAFTLAEVLVTLGIIGVVSAMTVPTLMQNYQRQSYVTQLHKVYNELSQALVRYQTDRNAVNLREAGMTSYDAFGEFQQNYFKIVKDCGNSSAPCFASSYKKLSGSNSNFKCYKYCMVLASGASVGLADLENGIFLFAVDVNGTKGPNIFGRDAFSLFIYTSNGVIDDLALKNLGEENGKDYTWDTSAVAPLTSDQREKNFARACAGSDRIEYHGCFGKILNDNWQMTY